MSNQDHGARLRDAYAALERGATDEAGALAEALLAAAPDEADHWRLLARVRLARLDRSGARAALERGATEARAPAALFSDLAEFCIRAADGAGALAAAATARRLGGDIVRLVQLDARAKFIAGEHAAALIDFELAAHQAPDNADLQLSLANAQLLLGLRSEALAVLDRYAARHPGGRAAAQAIRARLDPAAPERSLPALDAALAATPADPVLRLLKAMLLTLTGDAAAAQPYLDVTATDPRMRERWEAFETLRAAGCERFVGLPRAVLDAGLDAVQVEGHTAEFGVFAGLSLAHLAGRTAGPVHGFDSFRGLGEDWTLGVPKGTFDRGGRPPPVAANVVLHVGEFSATLPGFAAEAGPARLWHVDCDLYSSTKTVLDHLGDRLVPGSIVVFDDYLGFPDARAHEFRAWQEFVAARGLRYRALAYTLLGRELAVQVEAIG